jgi:parallel beta-helix repeat protein
MVIAGDERYRHEGSRAHELRADIDERQIVAHGPGHMASRGRVSDSERAEEVVPPALDPVVGKQDAGAVAARGDGLGGEVDAEVGAEVDPREIVAHLVRAVAAQDAAGIAVVLSLSAVTSGTFYFDYAADRIYVGDNPAGHKLEAAATEYAFHGSPQGVGTGVTIRGLIIEKYANPAQAGAIGHANMGANWTIRECEVRYNHGLGIRGGSGVVVARSNIHHNGQLGLAVYFARVDSNEIAYNNTAGYRVDWEAGGTKFSNVTNLMVRGNWVHHNAGAGLWSDYEVSNVTYTQNTVEDNADAGIFHEISWSATITNNVIRRNGWLDPSSSEGAGIMIMSSGGTGIEIRGNVLEGNKNGIILIQQDRGSGTQGGFVTRNVSVHDNTVTMASGQRTGAVRYGGDAGLWATNNNHFEHNTYNLSAADAATFIWDNNGSRTDSQWRAYGNDDSGTFQR